jgi:hypothetical protein
MKTNYTRQLLPLAAIIMVAAACDPFPAKPGGDPRVVRVTASDQSGTGNSVTVENAGTAAGTVVLAGAYARDAIYVHFNKPMNGATIQTYQDVDANGNPFVPPIDPASVGVLPLAPLGVSYDACRPAANLTLVGFKDGPPVISSTPSSSPNYAKDHAGDHLQRTTTCYNPGATTDGAQMVVTAGAPLEVGTTYKITGTVQDYQGKPVTLDISVTVDPSMFLTTTDGYQNLGYGFTYAYSMAVDWFPTAGATTYTVQFTATDPAGTVPPVWTDIVTNEPAANICDNTFSGFCEVWQTNATPSTTYWYRIQVGAAAPGAPDSHKTLAPIKVALDDYPVAPAAPTPGDIKLNWGRAFDAVEYVIERAPDAAGAPGAWAEVFRKPKAAPAVANPLDTPFVSRQWIDKGLTTGTTYWFRVTPVFGVAGGPSAAVKGTAVSRVSK